MSWTDEPLTITTKYKAVHINELRDAVDDLNDVTCPSHNISVEVSNNTNDKGTHFITDFSTHDQNHHQADNSIDKSIHYNEHWNSHKSGDNGAVQLVVDSAVESGKYSTWDHNNFDGYNTSRNYWLKTFVYSSNDNVRNGDVHSDHRVDVNSAINNVHLQAHDGSLV